jgi:hypothetical protein
MERNFRVNINDDDGIYKRAAINPHLIMYVHEGTNGYGYITCTDERILQTDEEFDSLCKLWQEALDASN